MRSSQFQGCKRHMRFCREASTLRKSDILEANSSRDNISEFEDDDPPEQDQDLKSTGNTSGTASADVESGGEVPDVEDFSPNGQGLPFVRVSLSFILHLSYSCGFRLSVQN